MALLPEIVRRVVRSKLGLGLVRRAKAHKQLPSISLYFTDPLADLIGSHGEGTDLPIQRLSRTVFASGSTAVVVRYAHKRDLAVLRRGRFERVYLLIDDDLESLGTADGLPSDYRRRLIGYRNGPYRRLMAMVTDVVAPSADILRSYPHKRTILLDPAQCHLAPALAHHERQRTFDVVFAATRSHLQDICHIAPALAEALRQRPDMRLTTFLNGHAPKMLRHLPNAIHLPMMEWARYRAFVAENRFHAAIAPALDTPFNRARSISRLHDHAAFGAAGLYSRQQPFDGVVTHDNSGLLLSNEPDEWRASLLDLAQSRPRARLLAEGGQNLSLKLGDKRRVRNFWLSELGLS